MEWRLLWGTIVLNFSSCKNLTIFFSSYSKNASLGTHRIFFFMFKLKNSLPILCVGGAALMFWFWNINSVNTIIIRPRSDDINAHQQQHRQNNRDVVNKYLLLSKFVNFPAWHELIVYRISSLASLEKLDVSLNRRITLPDELSNLRSLKELHISLCGLKTLPEWWVYFPSYTNAASDEQ
jgi:Leucine-rich repeat (LRR) protein